MLAVLVALGNWQHDRLIWKRELLAAIDARHDAPPVHIRSARAFAALTRATHDYHPVVLYGAFDTAHRFFYFAQIANAPDALPARDRVGYHVLTPFVLTDGAALLVDRGFVPARLKHSAAAPASGAVRAVLRWPSPRRWYDAADRPEIGEFYVRDPQIIGAAAGYDMPPFLADLAESGTGWPRGGQTRFTLSNRHLEYMLTWYGLAAVLVFISGLWHMRAARKKD